MTTPVGVLAAVGQKLGDKDLEETATGSDENRIFRAERLQARGFAANELM
jgi:hypothetical protein